MEKRVRAGSLSSAGLALAVVSAGTFGTSGAFSLSLIDVGWTPGAAVTARVVIAMAVLTVPGVLQLRAHRVSARAARTVVLYGVVAVAGAQLCYFNAVSHLSVAVALLLEYSGILLVIAWGWARHGHRPRRLTLAGGGAALAGAARAPPPGRGGAVDPPGGGGGGGAPGGGGAGC